MKIIVLWPHDCWHKIDTKQILVFLFFHSNLTPIYMCVLSRFSRVWLFATPWSVAHQAPLSMGFSRQEYWRELPSLPSGDCPTQGSNPRLICLLHMGPLPLAPPRKPHMYVCIYMYMYMCIYIYTHIYTHIYWFINCILDSSIFCILFVL